MIHVIRESGHDRSIALITGSTCTASPSALSITMHMFLGGCAVHANSAPKAGVERLPQISRQGLARAPFLLGQRSLQSRIHRTRVGAPDPCTIEVQGPAHGLRTAAKADQDVPQIQIRMHDPVLAELAHELPRRTKACLLLGVTARAPAESECRQILRIRYILGGEVAPQEGAA